MSCPYCRQVEGLAYASALYTCHSPTCVEEAFFPSLRELRTRCLTDGYSNCPLYLSAQANRSGSRKSRIEARKLSPLFPT